MEDNFDFSSPPAERQRTIHAHTLTDEQVKDLTEAYNLFDQENTGMISVRQLWQCMKAVAHVPTDLEQTEILTDFDPDNTGELTLSDFLAIMSRRYRDMTPEDEVILAFKVFDKEGNGYISESEFRHIMTNLGDKMSEDDVEEIIRDADSDTEGNINYVAFVAMMSER
ncbi:calmodulin [Scaptodrosophila lebanonensis]|uniref:Calmodulin n=1 Tax=Drosophila lebanonensis TaxID=7225 RepID=A0A6J2TG71_DROLE|nr:calmodulin [Scaptodrosophila lebanonensis]